MSKIDILKQGVGLVCGLGITQIVNGIVASTTKTDTLYQKTTVSAGSFVIGMVVSDVIREKTDKKVDSAVAWWKKHISEKNTDSIS